MGVMRGDYPVHLDGEISQYYGNATRGVYIFFEVLTRNLKNAMACHTNQLLTDAAIANVKWRQTCFES
jgi:hypothetical protein